jgi:hypothetical protein
MMGQSKNWSSAGNLYRESHRRNDSHPLLDLLPVVPPRMNSSQTETNELKDHFLGGFKKLSLFFRQRRHILDNPESVLVPDSARFPNGPLAFALIALSASYLLMAPISFVASNFVGLPPSALDKLIARLKSGNLAPESNRFSVDFLEHIAKEGTFVRNFRLEIAAFISLFRHQPVSVISTKTHL